MAQTGIVRNSKVDTDFNIAVSYTQTTEPSLPSNTNGGKNPQGFMTGSFPSLLRSLQITGDSTFTAKFSFKVMLEGLNIDNNVFQLAAAGSSGTEFVPTGTAYLIPPNSTLKVYAYNSGGATTNGTMNVFAVFELLDTEEQQKAAGAA